MINVIWFGILFIGIAFGVLTGDGELLSKTIVSTTSDTVKLIMSSSVAPIIIKPLSGAEFTFLVLPMRLKWIEHWEKICRINMGYKDI